MSRTIRRKNWYQTLNKSWHRAGRKVAGPLTTWYTCTSTGNGHAGVCNYVKMNEQDLKWEKINRFGESKHNNAYGPNRFYRNTAERRNRYHNQREINKYLNDSDYEVMCNARYVTAFDSYYW